MIVAYLLARTRYAWLAAGVAVAMALPRAFIYDITFLLPGLSERRAATEQSGPPLDEPAATSVPQPGA